MYILWFTSMWKRRMYLEFLYQENNYFFLLIVTYLISRTRSKFKKRFCSAYVFKLLESSHRSHKTLKSCTPIEKPYVVEWKLSRWISKWVAWISKQITREFTEENLQLLKTIQGVWNTFVQRLSVQWDFREKSLADFSFNYFILMWNNLCSTLIN